MPSLVVFPPADHLVDEIRVELQTNGTIRVFYWTDQVEEWH
jgi:hypothetical protein